MLLIMPLCCLSQDKTGGTYFRERGKVKVTPEQRPEGWEEVIHEKYEKRLFQANELYVGGSQDENGYNVFSKLKQASMFGDCEEKSQVMMDHMEFFGHDKNLDFIPGAKGSHWRVLKTIFICKTLLSFSRCNEVLEYCSRMVKNETVSKI